MSAVDSDLHDHAKCVGIPLNSPCHYCGDQATNVIQECMGGHGLAKITNQTETTA